MVFYGCHGKGIHLHNDFASVTCQNFKKQPANTDLDGKIAVVCVIFGFFLQFSERFNSFFDLSLRCKLQLILPFC